MAENILNRIVKDLRPVLAAAKRQTSELDLLRRMASQNRRASFAAAFAAPSKGKFHVIAELKKASPSKGVIRNELLVEDLARELEQAGATALSVLTEPNYFFGSMENLQRAAETVELPLLRKDFIFDPYQILEARANGASAVLLIAALLDDNRLLLDLTHMAQDLGLDVLGEAHNEREVERLAAVEVDCIGINARDLKTFQTDLGRVEQLLHLVPKNCVAIAESAITSQLEMERLAAAGANGFLIGETLMRALHPGEALQRLIGATTE